MNVKKSKLIKKIIYTIIGSMVCGVGVKLIVVADSGFDSISTLILGIMNQIQSWSSISFGTWSQILSVIFLIITFFWNRSLLGIGSVINGLTVGATVNMLSPVFENYVTTKFDLIVSVVGFGLMALGTAIYLASNLGSGPTEALMNCLVNHFGWSLRYARILLDSSFIVLGFLMGAKVGFATLIAMFGLGPMIQLFLKNIKSVFPHASINNS
ncbi:YitT family protein [Lactiplantibacillus daoliensis]|uniref:YitT family protein n=1 Tax=Lactiplantibacillus daoliensis TaxID=2559916 RepID=A0ABW1UJ35_9LACO|nr:membrane protein [Lactiplantibacillus daoliensis]